MRAVVLSVLRKRRLRVEQLSALDLASLGGLVCGLHPPEINRIDAYNLRLENLPPEGFWSSEDQYH